MICGMVKISRLVRVWGGEDEKREMKTFIYLIKSFAASDAE